MKPVDIARKLNKIRKQKKKNDAGKYLSVVRRIEHVAPATNGRYVAMTFDDGPNSMPPNPYPSDMKQGKGLTDVLLEILREYDSKGTFDVIGTTEYNYPDKKGKPNSPQWGGIKHDHYPDFGKDSMSGVKNQLDIARRIAEGGHEIANHGYSHVLFGPKRVIYGKREYLKSLEEVVDDLNKLHNLVKDKLGVTMKLSRPPHYVDSIVGGYTSYDAYRLTGYQYLAASFDGGGWKPSCGDYKKDVEIMVKPLERALLTDANSLNGQIIFQKDTANMSMQSPVVDALPEHLRLLKEEGYEVITVSELLKKSPFEDLKDNDSIFDSVTKLVNAGYCVGYKNNSFQADRIITRGELAMMITDPTVFRYSIESFAKIYEQSLKDVRRNNPYYYGINYVHSKGWFDGIIKNGVFDYNKPLMANELYNIIEKTGKDIGYSISSTGELKRRDVIAVIEQLVLN